MPGQIDLRRGRCSSAPPALKSQTNGVPSGPITDIHQLEPESRQRRWLHLLSRERQLQTRKREITRLCEPWQFDYAILQAYSRLNPNLPAQGLYIQDMWSFRVPVSQREPMCRVLERERIFAVQLSNFLGDCQKSGLFDDDRFSTQRARRSLRLQPPPRPPPSRHPLQSLSILPLKRKRNATEQLEGPGVKKTTRRAGLRNEGLGSNSRDSLGSLDVLPRELIDLIVEDVSLHDLPNLRLVNPAMKKVVDELSAVKTITEQLNPYVLSGLAWWTRRAEEEEYRHPDDIWSTPSQLVGRGDDMGALRIVSQAVDLVGAQEPDYDREWPGLVHAWWNVVTYAALMKIHCTEWDCEDMVMDVLDSEHSYLIETWEVDDQSVSSAYSGSLPTLV